jgi:hypothetical protein
VVELPARRPSPGSRLAVTGLQLPCDLYRLIQREQLLCARGRPSFTVVAFDVGDPTVDGRLAADLVQAFRRRARIGDTIGWLGRHRIGLLLPVTGPAGAHRVASDLCGMLGEHSTCPAFQVLSM